MMNNSADEENNTDKDIAFVSSIYQNTKNAEPSKDVDNNILDMAKNQLSVNDKKITKISSKHWLKHHGFQGAIAASFILVCLVYVIPPYTSEMSTQTTQFDTTSSESAPKQTMPQETYLQENFEVAKRREMQAQHEQAFAQKRTAETLRQSDELAASSPVSSTRLRTQNTDITMLLAQNKMIIENLKNIQQETNLSHQQLITKHENVKNTERNSIKGKVENDERNIIEVQTEYQKQHATMKDNLQKILVVDASIEIEETYSNFLSAEEITDYKKLIAKPE